MWAEFLNTAALAGALVLGMFITLWALSVAIKDSSIADIFWGFGFVIIVWVISQVTQGVEERRNLILALTTVWGLRLGLYLGWRNWGAEDRRYARLRQHVEGQGKNYAIHSLIHVYLLQGFFMWLVSLVLIFALIMDTPPALGWLAWAGVTLWVIGMVFETIGDAQLTRFRGDPANEGKVMDQGLWRYTRHPNYFGEITLWTGMAILVLPALHGWQYLTLISPVFVTVLLTRVSGLPMLEKRADTKWGGQPDYEAYKSSTPILIPRPPR